MQHLTALLTFEIEALLDSLRRDLREQEAKALANPGNAIFHGLNARQVKRLLEALNPRSACRAFYDTADFSRLVALRRDSRQAEA